MNSRILLISTLLPFLASCGRDFEIVISNNQKNVAQFVEPGIFRNTKIFICVDRFEVLTSDGGDAVWGLKGVGGSCRQLRGVAIGHVPAGYIGYGKAPTIGAKYRFYAEGSGRRGFSKEVIL